MINEKNTAIITYMDEYLAENLEKDFVFSLINKAQYEGTIIILDYGIPKEILDSISSNQNVIVYPCDKFMPVFSNRYVDIPNAIDSLDQNITHIMLMDGGDIWFQKSVAPIFEVCRNGIGCVEEDRVIGHDDFTEYCLKKFTADERERVEKVLLEKKVKNSGVICGPRELVKQIIIAIADDMRNNSSEFFGIDQIFFDYEWYQLKEEEQVVLDEKYNYVLVSNVDKFVMKEDTIYTEKDELVTVVHNAGANWRVLTRPFEHKKNNEDQYTDTRQVNRDKMKLGKAQMKGKQRFHGIKVSPMTDVWVDCYTTAIYSILLSFYKIDRNLIFQNSYTYTYDINENKNLGRVYVSTHIQDLVDKMLIDKKEYKFAEEAAPLDMIKKKLDEKRVILLGIDMYHGIQDTFQWHRHHIRHYILVEGYDDVEQVMYVLETGEQGYKEYKLTYEDIEKAIKGFNDVSYVYSLSKTFSADMISFSKVKENAISTVNSIDTILTHINDIWHVDEKYIVSMRDEIDTHLKSMANRHKANAFLLEVFNSQNCMSKAIEKFNELKTGYFELRDRFIQLCNDGKYYGEEKNIKEVFVQLLNKEKRTWMQLIELDQLRMEGAC